MSNHFARLLRVGFLGATLGVGSLLAQAAHAITVDIGVLQPTHATTYAAIGNTNVTASGTDVFTFSLTNDASLSLVSGIGLSVPPSVLSFLADAAVLTQVGGVGEMVPTFELVGGIGSLSTFQYTWGVLDSSFTYVLAVNYDFSGYSGVSASWAGQVGVTSAPIPPAIALLATALVGMGAAGWRRKRQTASPK
jgi:hypothetical protein